MPASPSKLDTVGSESTRAVAVVRSCVVALGTVGENCWLQHVQLVDICESTSKGDCEPEHELDRDETSEDEDDYERE